MLSTMPSRRALRGVVLAAAMAVLAACQTVPPLPAFSESQIAAMQDAGFEKRGDEYFLDFSNRVLFDFDASEAKPETVGMIRQLGGKLMTVGIHGARVEGHTDSSGETDYNKALSFRRASAVAEALVQGGMPRQNLRIFGLGESDPIDSNATEEGRAQNRRVALIISVEDVSPE